MAPIFARLIRRSVIVDAIADLSPRGRVWRGIQHDRGVVRPRVGQRQRVARGRVDDGLKGADRREVSRVISVAGTGHGYAYEALSFRKRNKKMEPFVVTVSQRPEEETLYNHDGEEFLLILKGQAEVILDDERIFLDEGDAVYFDATLKHRLLSYGGAETQVLAIVTR